MICKCKCGADLTLPGSVKLSDGIVRPKLRLESAPNKEDNYVVIGIKANYKGIIFCTKCNREIGKV